MCNTQTNILATMSKALIQKLSRKTALIRYIISENCSYFLQELFVEITDFRGKIFDASESCTVFPRYRPAIYCRFLAR